ncbi:response regulator transcription factor [Streptomyces roseirectus]|uniref:Response regulator transcription factor n=1 Tax=Streptomyces roseirectus TaxID=2768066 RepID=A0A7H0ICG7_9ACTN|nr:response regulator transcription factor [Streptomyces roseirectus]
MNVIVADDNPVVRAGLTALLTAAGGIDVVAQAVNGREACELTESHRPDVVLLDVRMPEVDGLAALPRLVRLAAVLMLTYSGESRTVRGALRLGARGYLVHGEFGAEELVAAVRDVAVGRAHLTPTAATAVLEGFQGNANAHLFSPQDTHYPGSLSKGLSQVQPLVGQSPASRGRFRLSAREAEIMDLIASGMSNHQIAAACFISEKTVKNHINRIFAKLHSTSRAEATAKWLGTAPPPVRGVS